MKRLVLGILTVMMLTMTGCGDGTTVVVAPATSPPSIANLQFSKDAANLLIVGSFDFLAPDVDLDLMKISVVNSGGFEVFRSTTDLSLYAGLTSGTIPFSVDYANFPNGSYTFTIFVTDLFGVPSNPLFGAFQVP